MVHRTKMRKFYTSEDYEHLPKVGNAITNTLHTHTVYKVNIPKQLRLEPWDLYESRNRNGIQFEHVHPPMRAGDVAANDIPNHGRPRMDNDDLLYRRGIRRQRVENVRDEGVEENRQRQRNDHARARLEDMALLNAAYDNYDRGKRKVGVGRGA
jgi:hypothetical protein